MSVIPLAAMLVHHCVDEDGMVCIEMHAPTIREMAIAAKEEHDSFRARIAELEKERDAMRARLAPSLEYCEAGPCGYGDDEIDRLSARLEKAEAERDDLREERDDIRERAEFYQNERDSERARAERLQERLDQFAAHGAENVAEMLDQRQALLDERDRYLAAIRDAVRAYDRLAKGGYGGDLAVVWAALRRIAEEASRAE